MKTTTCIAIDDEPLALLVITQFCERFGGLELTTFSEPRVGLEEIRRRKPDLVFLDIEMNSISGLDIAATCRSRVLLHLHHGPRPVCPQRVRATRYLRVHKPFAYERFEKAVEKAIRRNETRHDRTPDSIVVKQEYNNVTIPVNDILYIEAMENYTKNLPRERRIHLVAHQHENPARDAPRREFPAHSPLLHRPCRQGRDVLQEAYQARGTRGTPARGTPVLPTTSTTPCSPATRAELFQTP